jgi:hypothetical protein
VLVPAKQKLFKAIGYAPHLQQMDFHTSERRFRVAACGRRFGKSTMAARDLEPELFKPDKRFWIVGPTYDLGEKEFRVIWDDLMVKMGFARDKRIQKGYAKKQGNMFIEFPWNTRVEVRSADHPSALVGEALDGVIMSEAAKHKFETWSRFIRPALSDKRGFATFPSTPEGFNWFHDIWQLGRDPDHPLYQSWSFPSWANTAIYPTGFDDPEIQDLLRTTSTEWFDQEIGAKFTAFVGKIFSEFDETIHVHKLPFHPEWPNYLFIDWGFTNPSAWIEVQITPRDQVRVWREHYKAGWTVPRHIEFMKTRDQPPGYHLDLAFGDSADPEAAAQVTQGLVGCHTDPKAKENWRQGIDLYKGFLKVREDGDPGFLVDVNCKHVIKEHNDYRSKEPVNGKNVPELAQNVSNHTIDAIRYGLMHIFELGANVHLSDVYNLSELMERAEREAQSGDIIDAPYHPGVRDVVTSNGSGLSLLDLNGISDSEGDRIFGGRMVF